MNTATVPSHCFLCISIAGGPPETVVIELESTKLPKTSHNFASLCASPETTSKQRPLFTYRGCQFHRIVPKFMVQSGDFEKFNGSGGYSIYGGTTFEDEGMNVISHNAAGVVSMANRGKDTNASQFFITLEAAPHLNGKHVAFGRVVEGMNVVHRMAMVECEGTQPVPMQRILIVDCGHGRGPPTNAHDEESSQSSDGSYRRKRKKRDKKKRKKHRSKKRRKRDRRGSSDEDSSVSSSSNDSQRRRRTKKHKKRKRHHSSNSDSNELPNDDSRRRRSKSHDNRR